jgi:hypothetical protein
MFKQVWKCMHDTVIWIHNLTTRWRWMVSFTTGLMCLCGKRPPPVPIRQQARWSPSAHRYAVQEINIVILSNLMYLLLFFTPINILGVILEMQKCTTKVLIQVSHYYCSVLTQIMTCWQILEKSSRWNLKKINLEVLKLLCIDEKKDRVDCCCSANLTQVNFKLYS